jgi:hypothetical protein
LDSFSNQTPTPTHTPSPTPRVEKISKFEKNLQVLHVWDIEAKQIYFDEVILSSGLFQFFHFSYMFVE